MPVHPDFRHNLKRAVKQSELSAQEIAERVGVTRATLYNWMKGRTAPSREDAERAARALSLPRDHVWIEDGAAADLVRLGRYERFAQQVGTLLAELEAEAAREAPPPKPPRITPPPRPLGKKRGA